MTLRYFDSGGFRHQMIPIFDSSISLRHPQRPVVYAIKFHYPWFESFWRGNLPVTNFVGHPVPRDQSLCPRPASRCPDTDNRLESSCLIRQINEHLRSIVNYILCKLDHFFYLYRHRGFLWRPECRLKFQRSHPSRCNVTESFYGGKVILRSAVARKPGVNERVAKFIRNGIGEHSWQTMKCITTQLREREYSLAALHHDWCDFKSFIEKN